MFYNVHERAGEAGEGPVALGDLIGQSRFRTENDPMRSHKWVGPQANAPICQITGRGLFASMFVAVIEFPWL